MKKLVLYITILFLLLSCKSQQFTFNSLDGSFAGSEKVSKHTLSWYVTLELKQDGTCTLRKNLDLALVDCKGEWSIINDNLIEIKCNDNPVLSDIEKALQSLQSGSSIEGKLEIKILNKNKLEFDNIILKRKK
jgi:hypothetical protein